MGIYDRDYARQDKPGLFLAGQWSAVTTVMILTAAIYLVDVLLLQGRMREWLGLEPNLFQKPWQCYQLLTYGFLHSTLPGGMLHIAGNMFMFWLFGRDVESVYGKKEFWWIYLTAIVVSGLGWVALEQLAGHQAGVPVVGASGGVAGIITISIVHFPRRTLLFWGVLPVPAALLGAFWLLEDVYGAITQADHVAYTAHLAGVGYGFLYYSTRWTFGRLVPRGLTLKSLRPGPKLRVHDPDEHEEALSEQVDQILRKIKEQGQDSLSAKERRTLEIASRRYQQKHR